MLDTFIRELVKQYGSPLYVFDEDSFVANYKHLLDSFRFIYPNFNIAYSYKTNYTPYICKIVRLMNGYAEVVSSMEYELAKRIGYSSDRIIFNGPIKGNKIYEQLLEGGVVNIDNLDELQQVLSFAKSTSQIFKIAFRVNIDIGQGFISRFGIDIDNGDLEKAFIEAKKIPNISIIGLHCHVGKSRSIKAWQNRIEKMLYLAEKFFINPPQFIDLGSGMSSIMEPFLAKQFGNDIPTYKEYAEVVAKAMKEKYGHLPLDLQPELITEPGTTVVSGYVSFLTSIQSIKTVKGKHVASFDGSMGNMGDICKLKQLPISIIPSGNPINEYENVDFVGYTCLEHDVMYKNYSGYLAVGDIVEFRNVGSYSNVFKPPFISPNCAMIAVSKNYGTKIIKKSECFDDIFATYVF